MPNKPQEPSESPKPTNGSHTSTDLTTQSSDRTRELAKASEASAAAAEIQAAMMVALRFPRSEDDAYGAMIRAAQRPSFQACSIYRFPRGGAKITGPSVNLAREFARHWKNLRYGFYVVSEDEHNCHVRGYAFDLESNTRIEQDATFKLLVYRRSEGWIKPDERDKRELINKHGAVCERNCLLKILPRDMVEDIMAQISENQAAGVKDDLAKHRKKIVGAFAELGIDAKQLETYLGNPLAQITAEQVVDLRQVYASLKDGNSRWEHYVKPEPKPQAKTLDELAQQADGELFETSGDAAAE